MAILTERKLSEIIDLKVFCRRRGSNHTPFQEHNLKSSGNAKSFRDPLPAIDEIVIHIVGHQFLLPDTLVIV
jgi:hypothetical protein